MRVLLLLLMLVSCAKTEQPSPLIVSAAASLKEVMTELVAKFPNKARSLQLQFAASGELEKQIMGGAPVDVFISASSAQVERLQRHDLLLNDTVATLATNRLIVITYAKSPLQSGSLSALLSAPEITHIAIGDPALVPAGEYAREALASLGLWEVASSRLVNAANVRQALDLVSRREAELGFVYETDLNNRSDVREVAEFPAGAVPPIVYPAAVLKQSRQPEASRELLGFLQSPEAQAIFLKYGFRAP